MPANVGCKSGLIGGWLQQGITITHFSPRYLLSMRGERAAAALDGFMALVGRKGTAAEECTLATPEGPGDGDGNPHPGVDARVGESGGSIWGIPFTAKEQMQHRAWLDPTVSFTGWRLMQMSWVFALRESAGTKDQQTVYTATVDGYGVRPDRTPRPYTVWSSTGLYGRSQKGCQFIRNFLL
ncbi:hypothetical protein BDR04DRAFT_1123307 [Suillus decipiens]|nr:hypothetical protein BDR04DRAFT_1123307 [Suillus decipiens]